MESDHKPLEAIFRKALNDTPVRLQRMLLRLQKYSIEIKYVPGRLMYVADTLSRAPTDDACDEKTGSDIDVHVNALYDSVNFSSDKLKKIKEETDKEPGLGNVRQYCLKGWPHTKNILESEAKPYWGIKEELHVIKGIVFRGNRVVIPTSLRKEMLHRIHEGHLGIEKCKYRARDVMWWPGMSAQVEALVAACATCAERRAAQPREPMRSHQVPGKPWEVLATDLFEFRNKHYILVVDYYSKYVEVVSLSDIRSETIITQLKSIFARHGIPKKLVSDNGRQFTSAVFQSFVEKWEFEHVTSSPYYSRSNGLAERNVQTVKKLMEKAQSDGTDPYLALLNFRNTPVSGESYSPAQLLMARRLNTRLPVSEQLLAPKLPSLVAIQKCRLEKNEKSKKHYDVGTRPLKPLHPNEQVRMRESNAGRQTRWMPVRVEGQAAQPRSYWLRAPDGSRYRRNRQHILSQPQYDQMSENDQRIRDRNHRTNKYYDDFEDNDNYNSDTQSQRTVSNNTGRAHTGGYYVTRSGRQVHPPDRL